MRAIATSRSEVETWYGSPSFTVDAGSSSSLFLDRSTGLNSNVKRIYREVGQLPSRGTGFLTLPSLGNLKVNSRSQSRPRGVERGVGKVHRRKEEISTRNFDYELGRGTRSRIIDHLSVDAPIILLGLSNVLDGSCAISWLFLINGSITSKLVPMSFSLE